MRQLLALLVAALLGLALLVAPAHAADPVLPGDYPDPSVTAWGGGYVATATSDRWEPVFPVLFSPDLVSWEQVGAVFDRAPAWAEGKRFWAPEVTALDGRLAVVFAGLRRGGLWCIGAATAYAPGGPWSDLGPVLCPPGGAIDPVIVRDRDGLYLAYKAKGVGGGLWIVSMDPGSLRPNGEPTPLLFPEVADEGVTEGPSFLEHDGQWSLFFSAGTCCRPPCTYVQEVARAPTLLGPYVRAPQLVLPESRDWKCTGHGTPVRRADGAVFLLHHGYRADDALNRRRQGLLTPLVFDPAGWPVAAGPVGESGVPAAPAADIADDFIGPRPERAWQWVARRTPPRAGQRDATLTLTCGRDAQLTRQIAEDRFTAAVTVLPSPGAAALAVRQRDGTLRGVELVDGQARMLRRTRDTIALGPPVAVPADRAVRLRVTLGADGGLTASAGGVPVPAGRGATGAEPVRVALACRRGGTARFEQLRVAGASPASRLAVASTARR